MVNNPSLGKVEEKKNVQGYPVTRNLTEENIRFFNLNALFSTTKTVPLRKFFNETGVHSDNRGFVEESKN